MPVRWEKSELGKILTEQDTLINKKIKTIMIIIIIIIQFGGGGAVKIS